MISTKALGFVRVLGIGLAGAVVAGCSDDAGGPEYSEIGVIAVDESGQQTDVGCTPLPVVPGGAFEREFHFGDAFSARVRTTRDQADVSFEGIADAESAHRSIAATELDGGYVDSVEVTTLDGDSFGVHLLSPCWESP